MNAGLGPFVRSTSCSPTRGGDLLQVETSPRSGTGPERRASRPRGAGQGRWGDSPGVSGHASAPRPRPGSGLRYTTTCQAPSGRVRRGDPRAPAPGGDRRADPAAGGPPARSVRVLEVGMGRPVVACREGLNPALSCTSAVITALVHDKAKVPALVRPSGPSGFGAGWRTPGGRCPPDVRPSGRSCQHVVGGEPARSSPSSSSNQPNPAARRRGTSTTSVPHGCGRRCPTTGSSPVVGHRVPEVVVEVVLSQPALVTVPRCPQMGLGVLDS